MTHHKQDLEEIFEADSIKEICDFPDLKVVKRLSCFEEICPSENDTHMLSMLSCQAQAEADGLDSPQHGFKSEAEEFKVDGAAAKDESIPVSSYL